MKVKTKSNHPPRRGHLGGFTLIELLMVIAVIGILSALTVTGMSKARQAATTAEATAAARSLIQAFLLTPADNNGRYMIGYGDTGKNIHPPGGPPIASRQEPAKRYPWRIASYLDGTMKSLYVGPHRDYYERTAANDTYMTSLYPSFGINSIFVGGHYDGRKHSPDFQPGARSRDQSTYPKAFWVLSPWDAHAPSDLIVFASSLSSPPSDYPDPLGFYRVLPPQSPFMPNWGAYNAEIPASMGHVSLEYGERAVTAQLDGSVRLLEEDELRDMRRWSNQAALANDPNFSNWERTP
jgi:prepilin-type N-terminal cleavage/methylation domain-containing protein